MKKQQSVTVSVSMPKELVNVVKTRLLAEPDLTFSQYARRLIREDLARGAAVAGGKDKEVAA